MQSKVATNYAAFADDNKKARSKGEIEKQPCIGSFDLHHSEAHTFQSIGEFKKAIASYSKALEIKPGDKKCLIARARCYLKIGNAEKALDDSNEIIVNDPEYVKSLLIKADALHQLTQFEYALVFYHRGRKLRPEMSEFGQGIQRAEEAIYNAIGENSGIVFKIPHNIQDFCDELDIQKKLSLSILASSKLKLLEKSETSDGVGSGNKTSRTEDKKGGDQNENDSEKSSKKQEVTSVSNDLEVDEAVLEKKVKMMNSSKSCKQLLGELYADKEFLESILNETEMANNQSDANKQIRSLTIKGLNFLGTRSEFWQQQKPLYSRNHEKVLREQSYHRNKSEIRSLGWIEEDLKSIEYTQSQGRYRESLEKAQKLLKSLEKLPDGGSKMVKVATIYNLMGKACVELADDKQALKWYRCEYQDAVKNKLPESERKALENIGRLHMKMGSFKEALKEFQKCFKKESSSEDKSWLMYEMGRCCFELGKFRKAEECAKKCLEFAKEDFDEPQQLKAIILIGQSQEKRRQNQEALKSYKEALALCQLLGDSLAEEFVEKAISDLELKVQGHDDGVHEETSEEEDDDDDSYDEDDFDDECDENKMEGGDDDDGGGANTGERFSVASTKSGHALSQMSSSYGRISKEVPANFKKCPQSKDNKTSKVANKNSKESKTSTDKSNFKKNENLKKRPKNGSDNGNNDDDDDDEDEDGVKGQRKKLPEKASKKTITYNITTKTGNLFTAGTKSDVTMVMYGKYGKTESILLTNPYNNPIPFEQGKTDKFMVKAADVGNIKQIKIFHGGTQMNDGWFLEEASVTSPTFEEIYFFYVHRWLSKFNEDGKTTRTFEPTNVSMKPPVEYRITLVSGSGSQLVSGINVFLTIFGKHLRTDKIPVRLNPNNVECSDESFVDKIKVKGTDVKKITRIKVGLDNLRPHSKWLLEEVRVKLLGKTYSFQADRWFDKNSKEGSFEEELKPTSVSDKNSKPENIASKQTKGSRKAAPCKSDASDRDNDDDDDDGSKTGGDKGKSGDGIKKSCIEKNRTGAKECKNGTKKSGLQKKKKKVLYTVEVKTGEKAGSGTDAEVFVVLFGNKATSSKFVLRGSSDKNAFQRGALDIFQLECDDVGDILKIKIGHEGSSRNQGWFVESVRISTEKKKSLFKVGKWFNKDKGDGKTSRCLKPLLVPALKLRYLKEKDSKNHKKGEKEEQQEDNKAPTTTTTSDDDDDDVDGSDDDDENEDDDNSEKDEGGPGEKHHQLSNDEGDDKQNDESKQTESTIAEQVQTSYRMEVKTGTRLGAGTDSNVFILIEGDEGKSEKILLDEKSSDKKSEKLFERGQTNCFTVKVKDVGNITGILIGHDGTGFGAGWFLEDLNIESASTGEVYHFHVGQWFDKKEGDGMIERHLLPSAPDKSIPAEVQNLNNSSSLDNDKELSSRSKHSGKVTYDVVTKTGSKLGAGTDANVYVVLIGENEQTERIYLKDVKKGDKTFERNTEDDFQLEAEDVGKIQKIIVGNDGENMGSGWFVDSIKVSSKSTDEMYTFEINDWIDKNERELEPTSVEKME